MTLACCTGGPGSIPAVGEAGVADEVVLLRPKVESETKNRHPGPFKVVKKQGQ